jgi:hypothetical protein
MKYGKNKLKFLIRSLVATLRMSSEALKLSQINKV